MTSEGVLKRKRQNLDVCNTSKLISPFVTWEGPSKSRSARNNRPNRMRAIARTRKVKHFVQRVLQFRSFSFQSVSKQRFSKTQHPRLQTLTFAIVCNTSWLICEITTSHRRYCKNKQKSVFRVECFATVKVVLLRRSKSAIFKNAILLA